jgi:uncharacterized protein (DUF1697 family)
MNPSDHKYIALLRGINVGGHNKIPMAGLRELCGELGLESVQSYIASGNLVFSATGNAPELESMLEEAILGRYGFTIPVIVRQAAEWDALVDSNPFPGASETEPNRVLMGLAKAPIDPGVVDSLRKYAVAGERMAFPGQALWVHFPAGAGQSKISPAVLDRAAGSPVTGRNWRTVLKIQSMLCT